MRWMLAALLIMAAPAAVAVPANFNCYVKESVAFKAEISTEGKVNVVNVRFENRPSAAIAQRILQGCMEMVAIQLGGLEALGTAWVGNEQVRLLNGKEYLVYFPSEGKVRPFGSNEAIARLKKKQSEGAASPAGPTYDNFSGLSAMTREVRSRLRDPDSMVVEKYGRKNDDGTQCMVYRARNGFGGLNVGYAVFSSTKSVLDDAAYFKRVCVGL